MTALQRNPRLRFYDDNDLSIGRTPAYSEKCRSGAALICDADKRGLLGPGNEIVESSSGNTGIALVQSSACGSESARRDSNTAWRSFD